VFIKVLTADVVSSGRNINAGGVKFPGFEHTSGPDMFRTLQIWLETAISHLRDTLFGGTYLLSCFSSAYMVRGTGKSPAIKSISPGGS
jgi:hypothetical protein